MATFLKPGSRLTTSDWFTANYALATNAERERKASHDTRQESVFLRNETDNRTKWDQLDSNLRLADRVDKIRELKDLLERTLATLNQEISELSDIKDQAEQAQVAMNERNHINIENLVAREGRQTVDVVNDEVNDQLLTERTMLDAIKLQLQGKIDEAFEQLCMLQDIRCDTLEALQDKNLTLDIDTSQYNLTAESAGITFKPDPTRIPKRMTSSKQFEDLCYYNKMRAAAEILKSLRLRECIFTVIQQTKNDANSQNIATQYALRRRCHEMDMALNELFWQKEQTELEINEEEVEIKRLTYEINKNKPAALKLVHSRLETRLYRPNADLCNDNAHYGLTDECKQLEATLAALKDKLRQTQHSLNCLEANMHSINCEIETKKRSLAIDTQCIDSRDKLNEPYPLTVTQRNLELVGGARNKSDTVAF